MIWTARDLARVLGFVLLGFGFLCLPVGIGASPKRDTSVFFNVADMGLYLKVALILMPLGLVVIIVSFFLPGDD
jgi:hypothetical protein